MNQNCIYYIVGIGFILLMNLTGFILMCVDKKKAKRNAWRISERTFFVIAVIGGAIGVWLGMQRARHKTKHVKFLIGIPMIILLQLIVVICVFLKYGA